MAVSLPVTENILNKSQLKLPFYFISDVHLSTYLDDWEKNRRKHLFSLFESIAEKKGTLFILGDFFDFWFDFPDYIHPSMLEIIEALDNLTKAGVAIHYVAGNHDYWTKKIMHKLGIDWYPGHITFTHSEQKFYLCHGDGLLRADFRYRLLKKVLRHPLAIAFFKMLGPQIGHKLGDRANNKSKENYTSKKEKLKPYAEEMMQWHQQRLNEGFDISVMGHIHYPIFSQDKQKTSVILGDWNKSENRYYGIFDGEKFQHVKFDLES